MILSSLGQGYGFRCQHQDVSSHRYGSVPVPVVPGYIADKSQAGQLEVPCSDS